MNIDYKQRRGIYLFPHELMEMYPVIYHDSTQPDKWKKYLVLHEIHCRHMNNYLCDWGQYKGVVTWNRKIYRDQKDRWNMVYVDQIPGIYINPPITPTPYEKKLNALCCVYGPPGSIDSRIMCARYTVPLELRRLGVQVDAYGAIPAEHRAEYHKEWHEIYKYGIKPFEKGDVVTNYRFCIAFENSIHEYWADNWITEKIYDCFMCGTIPIYWGIPDIFDRVPKELFIDFRDWIDDLPGLVRYMREHDFSEMSRRGLEFVKDMSFVQFLKTFDELK